MRKKIKYKREPLGKLEIKNDFLPDPKNLILKEETVKVTLSLTKESLDYFKKEAKKHHIAYQRMIRSLMDRYVMHYKNE